MLDELMVTHETITTAQADKLKVNNFKHLLCYCIHVVMQSLKREKKSLTNKLTGSLYLLKCVSVFLNTEAKNIIVQLESQCTGLHRANRKLKEELDRLHENMEISRDRENFVYNELSKAVLKVHIDKQVKS